METAEVVRQEYEESNGFLGGGSAGSSDDVRQHPTVKKSSTLMPDSFDFPIPAQSTFLLDNENDDMISNTNKSKKPTGRLRRFTMR